MMSFKCLFFRQTQLAGGNFPPSTFAKSPTLAPRLVIISSMDIFTNYFFCLSAACVPPCSKEGSNYQGIKKAVEGFRYITPLNDILLAIMLLAD